MKVVYHQVTQTQQESFRVLEVKGPNHPCSWHFHPEYQIGLVLEGSGHRIVGDNISPLDSGDLAMLGPNLPHVWQFEEPSSTRKGSVHAIIVYFKEDALGADFFERPEARSVRRLLNRSKVGLSVGGKTRRAATKLLKEMVEHDGFKRVIDLLELLHLLATSEELMPISSAGFLDKLPDAEGQRLQRVTRHVQEHLGETIRRDDVAAVASLSPAAFSRFFRSRTGKTFQDFVSELRIGRACRLLSDVELNVTEVALMCGFANVACFNRAFRRNKNVSPTQYRKKMQVMN